MRSSREPVNDTPWWDNKQDLKSKIWSQQDDLHGLVRRALVRAVGYSDYDLALPIVGICNSWSELNPGHYHLRQLAEAVKRGVWQAGGFPLEFNTISLCEPFHNISTLVYRNLMAMETEEMIVSQPLDAVVLLSSCDKNVPAQLMAAASADIPAILVPGGSMLPGRYKGESLGCCTDGYRVWARYIAGDLDDEEYSEIEKSMMPTYGACAVMGTANTMQCLAEALGMTLPGAASIPAPYGRIFALAEESGRQVMKLLRCGIRPSHIMTEGSFRNAIAALMALGGSTNAVIHLIAIAKRLGIRLSLDTFDAISRQVPVVCNIKPVGTHPATDLDGAGGIPAVMTEIYRFLQPNALTVTGACVQDNLRGAKVRDRAVILPLDHPVSSEGGLAVLRGNIAPMGAIIKQAAVSERFLRHEGPALVFDSFAAAQGKLLDAADVSESTVIVVRNEGPVGGPGMPEVGDSIPIPKTLLKKGVRDLVRVTDARISGTAFGTIVVHVDPEAAVGGPLAAVRTGDIVSLDVPGRRLDVRLSDGEIKARLEKWVAPRPRYGRGYRHLFEQHVQQASEGCDFDFA